MKTEGWFQKMHEAVESVPAPEKKKLQEDIKLDAIRAGEQKKEEQEEKMQKLREKHQLKTEAHSG